MARAYNIHVVLHDGHVVAAFTVAHELETWVTRLPRQVAERLTFTTIRDGAVGAADCVMAVLREKR